MEKQTHMVVLENFGACNMRCTYCFPEHMWQRQGHRGAMSEETYRGILGRILATTSAESVDVHLAGGEPLLAGRHWLTMAFRVGGEIAQQYGKKLTFSLQTNATLVTPEWARFLADNHVTVGVSLDGNVEINEAVRGNTDHTLTGFRHLSEAVGRRPGVIVTVTRCNARRMHEVVDYLERLGVVLFRANQMGATAAWNAHVAPQGTEWAAARQDILAAIAAKRGQIMEFNLSHAVLKFVHSLLGDVAPFNLGYGCCDLRCPAGRQLMYFDQKGHAYPCPRANVTADARIGHYATADFEDRWNETIRQLDTAMTLPVVCSQCPAQFLCDYGCHAFNRAQGNFFEVNCDATKAYFQWVTAHLEDVARVYFYVRWRERLKERDAYEAMQRGIDLPSHVVSQLAAQLQQRLATRLAQRDLVPEILERRYGGGGQPHPAHHNRPAVVIDAPGKGKASDTRR
ncbi:MAG TPA: radical SAM protein [Candidatus Tectomicrobia bacterium]|jgi:radical SAM protein with 4Fe4S-binding SPASM domain